MKSWATLPKRFEAKLSQVGDCWEWTGSRANSGYGQISVGREICLQAHRYSWELHRGPIPEGLQIDHLCRNRACVNPDHLEPVTPAVNNARSTSPAAANAKKEFCQAGHPLSGSNLRIEQKRGFRVCLECKARRCRERRARLRGGLPAAPPMALRTHCPQGHPYDEANTVHTKAGSRQCRACRRERRAAYRGQRLNQRGAAA